MELKTPAADDDLSAVRQYALEHFDALLLLGSDILTALYGSRSASIVSGIIQRPHPGLYNANPLHPTTVWSGCSKHRHYPLLRPHWPWKPGYVGFRADKLLRTGAPKITSSFPAPSMPSPRLR